MRKGVHTSIARFSSRLAVSVIPVEAASGDVYVHLKMFTNCRLPLPRIIATSIKCTTGWLTEDTARKVIPFFTFGQFEFALFSRRFDVTLSHVHAESQDYFKPLAPKDNLRNSAP